MFRWISASDRPIDASGCLHGRQSVKTCWCATDTHVSDQTQCQECFVCKVCCSTYSPSLIHLFHTCRQYPNALSHPASSLFGNSSTRFSHPGSSRLSTTVEHPSPIPLLHTCRQHFNSLHPSSFFTLNSNTLTSSRKIAAEIAHQAQSYGRDTRRYQGDVSCPCLLAHQHVLANVISVLV